MIRGVYKFDFGGATGIGGAIVFIENGKLRGADTGLIYVGTYEEDGDTFSAQFMMKSHAGVRQLVTGASGTAFTVKVKGKQVGGTLVGIATIGGAEVQFQGRKLEDLAEAA